MRDLWYADNRDLIKWGVLLRLALGFEASRILQLAFYRPSEFGQLVIDGQTHNIPEEVIAHFRNPRTIGSISSKIRVTVFDPVFEDRPTHLQAVLALLPAFGRERCIVFLDPDTGLESRKPGPAHVLESELAAIWREMGPDDVLVLYQHQTNRDGTPWIESKKVQFEAALELKLLTID